MADTTRQQVFISYSHHDQKWLGLVQKYLKRYADVATAPWVDGNIAPGAKWEEEITKAIAASKAALLLVSQDFLDSEFIMKKEVPRIIEAADRGELKILWVHLRPSTVCDEVIFKYQALREPLPALSQLSDHEQEAALVEICQRIRKAVVEPPPPPPPPPPPSDPYKDVEKDQDEVLRSYASTIPRDVLERLAPSRVNRWLESAQQGFAPAQFLYAACAEFGCGIARNLSDALAWYRKAADQNHLLGLHNLGALFETGLAGSVDLGQARDCYLKAANQGFAPAQLSLGVLLSRDGAYKDNVQGVHWIRKAAEQGQATAQFILGAMLTEGTAGAKDDAQAAQWYRKAAEQGLAAAEYSLALAIEGGRGVGKNLQEAFDWMRKAAQHGHKPAFSQLARLYDEGIGVAVNKTEALAWCRKAADLGDAVSQLKVGIMYNNGDGTSRDFGQGMSWIQKAAEQNYLEAQHLLGLYYIGLSGAPVNLSLAYSWFQRAANLGHAEAQLQAGIMCEEGKGTPKDLTAAANWYLRAIEQPQTAKRARYRFGMACLAGVIRGTAGQQHAMAAINFIAAMGEPPDADYQLGILYENGLGVERNRSEALNMYRRAAAKNHAEAQAAVARLEQPGFWSRLFG